MEKFVYNTKYWGEHVYKDLNAKKEFRDIYTVMHNKYPNIHIIGVGKWDKTYIGVLEYTIREPFHLGEAIILDDADTESMHIQELAGTDFILIPDFVYIPNEDQLYDFRDK